ncbi:MAG: aminotransferase class IV [Chloroflexi bacterium]|nr:aminotransferase class IV [Chloroflexota bacterium]
MPAYIRVLHADGTLHPASYSAQNLTDAAQYEPDDGVYTVTNTFNTTQVLKMSAHLDRLEDSAKRAGIALRYDRAILRDALRRCILDFGVGDVRWRATVGKQHPDRIILTLEPFMPIAPELVENGVRVITAPNAARVNATAKTTGWMHQRGTLNPPEGIYDTILLDADGHMLEGLAANFYVIRDAALYTAPTSVVLPGISRQIVLEVAPLFLPVVEVAPHIDDLPVLAEAFITSASRGIVPVVEIDGKRIGAGRPGPFTRQLRTAYQAWVATHLEEL